MSDVESNVPVIRDEGVQLNTVGLMSTDVTTWTPEETVIGAATLIMFADRLAARIKEVKNYAGEIAKKLGVPPKGKPDGNPTLKAGGGAIRHETRVPKEPKVDLISQWCRESGVHDLIFPKIPSFQKDRFESMVTSGRLSQQQYDEFFVEKPYVAVVIKKPADVVAFFEELEAQQRAQIEKRD